MPAEYFTLLSCPVGEPQFPAHRKGMHEEGRRLMRADPLGEFSSFTPSPGLNDRQPARHLSTHIKSAHHKSDFRRPP